MIACFVCRKAKPAGPPNARAAHQVRDRPLVLDDPLALRVIYPEVARALREHPPKFATPLGPYLRAFFVMRSRFAEDELAVAVGCGVRQYVVLGAGFDTFAFDPKALMADLHRLGFTSAGDFDGDALNERYFKSRTDRLKVGGMGHMAMARV